MSYTIIKLQMPYFFFLCLNKTTTQTKTITITTVTTTATTISVQLISPSPPGTSRGGLDLSGSSDGLMATNKDIADDVLTISKFKTFSLKKKCTNFF